MLWEKFLPIALFNLLSLVFSLKFWKQGRDKSVQISRILLELTLPEEERRKSHSYTLHCWSVSVGNWWNDGSSQAERAQTELSCFLCEQVYLGMDLLVGGKKLQKRRITAEWIQTISSQSECNFCFLSNNSFKYSLLSADWVITSVWGWRGCERETSWASRGFLRAEIAAPYLLWWECHWSLLCSSVLIFLNRWIVTSKKGLSKEGGFPGSGRLWD